MLTLVTYKLLRLAKLINIQITLQNALIDLKETNTNANNYNKTFLGVSDKFNFYDNTSYELVDK